jgi:hypothetical protein
VAKLVARLLATAALWVRLQTSLKNTKWATYAKEWPTHSSPPKIKNIYNKNIEKKPIDNMVKMEGGSCRVVSVPPAQAVHCCVQHHLSCIAATWGNSKRIAEEYGTGQVF